VVARQRLIGPTLITTRGLIRSWLQAALADELSEEVPPEPLPPPPKAALPVNPPAVVAAPRPRHPRGFSKSQLEPILRAQGTLEKQPGRRKRGRPRVVASWFEELAATLADGTPLRVALQRIGITVDKSQIRALYRNREFRRMDQECRRSRSKV
jgi:hypothetical protein